MPRGKLKGSYREDGQQESSRKGLRSNERPTSSPSPSSSMQSSITQYYRNDDSIAQKTFSNTERILAEFWVLKEEFSKLKNENKCLRAENCQLRKQLNDFEQHSRKINIRIFNIEEKEDESNEQLEKNISSLFVNKLKLGHLHNVIDVTHRVGKKTEGKHRPVIVRLAQRRYVSQILQARKLLKGTRIGISEDLTRENIKLFNQCRKNEKYKDVWIRNGKIFVKKASNGNIERVEPEFQSAWDPENTASDNSQPPQSSQQPFSQSVSKETINVPSHTSSRDRNQSETLRTSDFGCSDQTQTPTSEIMSQEVFAASPQSTPRQ